jgi:hypothetical protein
MFDLIDEDEALAEFDVQTLTNMIKEYSYAALDTSGWNLSGRGSKEISISQWRCRRPAELPREMVHLNEAIKYHGIDEIK